MRARQSSITICVPEVDLSLVKLCAGIKLKVTLVRLSRDWHKMCQSKVPVLKGKIQQQNGTFQLTGGMTSAPGLGMWLKRKRGPDQAKGSRIWSSCRNGSSEWRYRLVVPVSLPTAHSSLLVWLRSISILLVTRHSSSGTHNKTSQSRPYPNATGPGSFRHPLANYQFDPGTTRMTGRNNSASSHSSDPQCMPSYYLCPV